MADPCCDWWPKIRPLLGWFQVDPPNGELFCLHPTREQLATLLDYVADVVEQRGNAGLNLDPGETADWLQMEAAAARQEPSGK